MPGVLETVALIVSSLATTVLGANLLYLGTYALAAAGLAFGYSALQSYLTPKPKVPKPEDGSYNLKQNMAQLRTASNERPHESPLGMLERKRSLEAVAGY